MNNFYGAEIEIWAVCGPVDNTEKNWPNYEQLLTFIFHIFMGISIVQPKKFYNMKVKNDFFSS